MALVRLFLLITFQILCARVYGDDFKEEMFIKPLLPTHLYTYFQFITQVNDETSCEYCNLRSF